ncbi:MAG: aminotransferase class V-fold PLP-dependent enzyme, partial [Campylobacter sp.]|nr:aminotransferase class V-fold PLP-dependent enzyme [Campylobacter sp.]
MAEFNFETLATHAGYSSKEGCGAMAVPIYLTTAFDFGTSEEAAARFALQKLGPIYTRLNNPTVDIFEARIAALEGGVAAIGTASGQAASFYAVANVASADDNIIMAQKVYGGTSNLMLHTLKKFGIETRMFDADSAEDLESLIDDKTKAIFFETLSNPQVAIPNFYKIIEIADKYGIISIVDNTVATPVLFNPIKKGADIVVHSASKYISGQGLTIAGAVVSGASTNKKILANPRYADF